MCTASDRSPGVWCMSQSLGATNVVRSGNHSCPSTLVQGPLVVLVFEATTIDMLCYVHSVAL